MTTNLNALSNGYRLHEYEIEAVLGQGGFGITYLVSDVNLGSRAAVKEYMPADLVVRVDGVSVHPRSEADEDTFEWGLQRFLDEAQTLARFQHPNIVPVSRYFEANNTAYLVMPYQEGESLDEVLRRSGTMNRAELDSLLRPLLDGLEAVHAAGILHRDVKPENIFVRADGSPVLLDFGAARQAMIGKTRSMTAIATPGYAPAEQYYSGGKQGPWTDIYSLACVAYEAISGKMPPEAPARLQGEALPPLAGLAGDGWDRRFLKAIEKAMTPDAAKRPQTIGTWRNLLYPNAKKAAAPARQRAAAAPGGIRSVVLAALAGSFAVIALVAVAVAAGWISLGGENSGGGTGAAGSGASTTASPGTAGAGTDGSTSAESGTGGAGGGAGSTADAAAEAERKRLEEAKRKLEAERAAVEAERKQIEDLKKKQEAEARAAKEEAGRQEAEKSGAKEKQPPAKKSAKTKEPPAEEAKATGGGSFVGVTFYRMGPDHWGHMGRAYRITLGKGGALRGRFDVTGDSGADPNPTGTDTGKWWMQGTQLCTQWRKWEQGKAICYSVKIDGKTALLSGGGFLAGRLKLR